ncbi:unnamed protein product [Anisakis simplex]|uniref:Calpain clp-1 (inferred by orthology to a C. elegans protein) n=1 Tax=Anisakis simplex TaxID=6269 RepID=A0A0M3KA96_ANISI|nr:unnamed protein product [Anisakis simplex]
MVEEEFKLIFSDQILNNLLSLFSGSNVTPDKLRFKVADVVTILTGQSAHHFSSVDPVTGHIIGAIAGNELFNLGGKDNKLGIVGKVVLDNIISEKFKRKIVTWSTGSEPYAKYIKDTSGIASGRALISSPFDYHDRRLFEDPEFPTCDKSLFFHTASSKRIEWKRPGEIVDNPRLIYEGHSRFDVVQGLLSDCWLLAAVANLTLRDELFYRVVPPDQSFTENYAGIFHFQFWHYGQWVDVVVDDRLPTSNGELVYMHSRENNEFWSALLEKAYAKLFGSYEALKGGATAEALEDMTGGLTEFYDLENPPENLKEIMERGFEKGSLFGCSIEADPHEHEKRMLNGLVKGHAYSITGMRTVNGRRGRTTILRIRNPWGNEQEWNGPWSDRSLEWRRISEQEKKEMDLKIEHDGEFWISFDDFVRNFQRLGICNLGPEVMDEVSLIALYASIEIASIVTQTVV